MIEHIRPRASLVGSVLSFLFAIALSLVVVELIYSGYGESSPPAVVVSSLFAGGWAASIAASLILAIVVRAHWLPMVTIGVLGWPVALMFSGAFVFATSCAGFGPHNCLFS